MHVIVYLRVEHKVRLKYLTLIRVERFGANLFQVPSRKENMLQFALDLLFMGIQNWTKWAFYIKCTFKIMTSSFYFSTKFYKMYYHTPCGVNRF